MSTRSNSTTFPCGHPRTPSNLRQVGIGNGVRCKICRDVITKRSAEKRAREKAGEA